MQKLQETLTEEQRKMIDGSYLAIKNNLTRFFINKKPNRKIGLDISKLYDALSYLPDLAVEYRPELSNGKSFINFATERCIKRLIDEFRSMNKFLRIKKGRKEKVNKIKEQIIAEKGYCSEYELVEGLIHNNLDPEKYLKLKDFKRKALDKLESTPAPEDPIEEINVEDQINGISKKADVYFAELSGPGMEARNSLARTRKRLLKEYLIPMAMGSKIKSLSSLAEELDLSEGRLSQLTTDDSMKNFIRTFYSEMDLNKIPVVTKTE
jgi:DNA-directed RNA polymerase specialized sigma subunit